MPTTLSCEGLLVDRIWSADEVAEFERRIDERRGPSGFYHKITIKDRAGRVLQTPGIHECTSTLAALDRFGFPRSLEGKTVLDIGCNAGFYSFAAKLRGARSVLGVDYFQHCVDQALLMREILQIDVEFRQGDGETLDERLGPFDVVINTGVLYHLQNPMRVLTNLGKLTREMMFLESEMLIDPAYSEYAWFIEHEYCRDGSNWWIYGPECIVRMVRAAGFARAEFKGFVWKPGKGQKTPEGFRRQGRGVVLAYK
ncbi:MAG TPA: DUF1698 domain-containing protein [Vicinamibacterales bacterium]|nr:DUF1698 domain-containing protein [Vicinamibacterales bacterium]